MSVKNSMTYIPLSSIDSSTFTGSYQLLVSSLSASVFTYKIVNNSTKDVTVSLDGSTDMDFVPTSSAVIYDLQSNKQPQNDSCSLPKGTKVYVKGSAGTGSVYFVGLTQAQGA